MNVTIFTANKPRHNYLIEKIGISATNLFVFREKKRKKIYNKNFLKSYSKKVLSSEKKFFINSKIKKKNIKIKNLEYGELNQLDFDKSNIFFKSDLYIVFGSSIIRNKLLQYLLKKKAINIHMGISPYYNGTDCNFWALFDNNPHLVGGTLQYLSPKVDQGNIISVVKSKYRRNIFDYSMLSVKLTIDKLSNLIKKKNFFSQNTRKQNISKNIRTSQSNEFTEEIVKTFFNKKIILKKKKFNI